MMPVNQLHHFTLLTNDVEKTSDFLKTSLGFTDGFTPDVDFPLTWLYCDDQPVIHLVDKGPVGANGGGRVDHIAFNCSDYPAMKARLDKVGANITEQSQPEINVHQIFVETPEGVWLELVFNYQKYLNDIDKKIQHT